MKIFGLLVKLTNPVNSEVVPSDIVALKKDFQDSKVQKEVGNWINEIFWWKSKSMVILTNWITYTERSSVSWSMWNAKSFPSLIIYRILKWWKALSSQSQPLLLLWNLNGNHCRIRRNINLLKQCRGGTMTLPIWFEIFKLLNLHPSHSHKLLETA